MECTAGAEPKASAEPTPTPRSHTLRSRCQGCGACATALSQSLLRPVSLLTLHTQGHCSAAGSASGWAMESAPALPTNPPKRPECARVRDGGFVESALCRPIPAGLAPPWAGPGPQLQGSPVAPLQADKQVDIWAQKVNKDGRHLPPLPGRAGLPSGQRPSAHGNPVPEVSPAMTTSHTEQLGLSQRGKFQGQEIPGRTGRSVQGRLQATWESFNGGSVHPALPGEGL